MKAPAQPPESVDVREVVRILGASDRRPTTQPAPPRSGHAWPDAPVRLGSMRSFSRGFAGSRAEGASPGSAVVAADVGADDTGRFSPRRPASTASLANRGAVGARRNSRRREGVDGFGFWRLFAVDFNRLVATIVGGAYFTPALAPLVGISRRNRRLEDRAPVEADAGILRFQLAPPSSSNGAARRGCLAACDTSRARAAATTCRADWSPLDEVEMFVAALIAVEAEEGIQLSRQPRCHFFLFLRPSSSASQPSRLSSVSERHLCRHRGARVDARRPRARGRCFATAVHEDEPRLIADDMVAPDFGHVNRLSSQSRRATSTMPAARRGGKPPLFCVVRPLRERLEVIDRLARLYLDHDLELVTRSCCINSRSGNRAEGPVPMPAFCSVPGSSRLRTAAKLGMKAGG